MEYIGVSKTPPELFLEAPPPHLNLQTIQAHTTLYKMFYP